MKQATDRQLTHYNTLRMAKGYVPVHPEDWVGVTSGQAIRLIRKWTTIAPARR